MALPPRPQYYTCWPPLRIAGLRGEDSIAELCRREGIVQNLYYRWSKEFLEAGKKRLARTPDAAGSVRE
jgi:transposase